MTRSIGHLITRMERKWRRWMRLRVQKESDYFFIWEACFLPLLSFYSSYGFILTAHRSEEESEHNPLCWGFAYNNERDEGRRRRARRTLVVEEDWREGKTDMTKTNCWRDERRDEKRWKENALNGEGNTFIGSESVMLYNRVLVKNRKKSTSIYLRLSLSL